jgi:hypothetical protein
MMVAGQEQYVGHNGERRSLKILGSVITFERFLLFWFRPHFNALRPRVYFSTALEFALGGKLSHR